RDEADDTGIARLEHPIGPLVHDVKLVNKSFDDDLRGIEHRDAGPWSPRNCTISNWRTLVSGSQPSDCWPGQAPRSSTERLLPNKSRRFSSNVDRIEGLGGKVPEADIQTFEAMGYLIRERCVCENGNHCRAAQ